GSNRECTFILRNEDHTLGNALRCTLMRNPRVSFAGCSVPHPLTKEIHLRIVTVSDDVAPADCLAEGLRDLYASAESLLHQFDSAYDEFVASNESAAGDGADLNPNQLNSMPAHLLQPKSISAIWNDSRGDLATLIRVRNFLSAATAVRRRRRKRGNCSSQQLHHQFQHPMPHLQRQSVWHCTAPQPPPAIGCTTISRGLLRSRQGISVYLTSHGRCSERFGARPASPGC
uniref:RNA_pol_L_2 domain-containing protein n=1 Tax=Macrostomum lignano TaxID=282301 RepID=A0A1I8JPM8_9PLAT